MEVPHTTLPTTVSSTQVEVYPNPTITAMPPLRPRTPQFRSPLHIPSIRLSSKKATPPNTDNEQASETSRDEQPTISSRPGAASDTVGALIENSTGMHWEKLWLKDEKNDGKNDGKNDKKRENTKGVGREQMAQKESNKTHEAGDSHNQGADDKDGGKTQVSKAEAEAKGDEEWERSMRRSMK